MSLLDRLFGSEEQKSGVEELAEALREVPKDVDLTGVAREPILDERGPTTAVVPVDLFDQNTDQPYGNTQIEFAIETDRGKEDFEDFIVGCNEDMDTIDDVTFDAETLRSVESTELEVDRDIYGNVKVVWASNM